MQRRRAREIALQAVFQMDVGKCSLKSALAFVREELPGNDDLIEFASRLVEKTWRHRAEADKIIQRYAREWTLDRIANVDRNIMRIAIAEILYFDDIPHSVSINEAVELAKLYGDADSPRFINGILGEFVRSRLGQQIVPDEPAGGR